MYYKEYVLASMVLSRDSKSVGEESRKVAGKAITLRV